MSETEQQPPLMETVLIALNPLETGFLLGCVMDWRRGNGDNESFLALQDKLLEHYPWKGGQAATVAAEVERLRKQVSDLSRCLLPVWMGMAEMEMVDGKPPADDAVVLNFMGSGASDRVTAGEVRKALGVKATE
jgi:hypothetical protein